MKRPLFALYLMLCGVAASPLLMAQPFPGKPLRIVVGLPAGNLADIAARVIGNKMAGSLGQPIVVENRVGANATIATQSVIKAAPDGYTLLFVSSATVHPTIQKVNAVVLARDMAAVSNLLTTPFGLYVSGKLPVTSLAELIAYARANPPDKLNMGSIVPQFDLLMHLLKSRTGISYTLIPFKGGGAAIMSSLTTGEIDFAFGGLGGFPALIQAGSVRALLVTGAKRSPLMPNVPTATELGVQNFEVGSNQGLWAPLGTPNEIVRRLSVEAVTAAKDPEVAEQFRRAGAEAVGTTPEEQLRTFEAEMKVWAEAARIANYQPQ